jgi:hypothetical protein
VGRNDALQVNARLARLEREQQFKNRAFELGIKEAMGLAAVPGADGLGWTGGSYNAGTGVVEFTSTDGLGFVTGDLRGAPGADGLDGADGIDGLNGADGADGLNGADGADGSDALALAGNDQALTGNRLITNGGSGWYLYTLLTDTSGATKTASSICQPSIPRWVMAASETGVSSTALTVAKDAFDIACSAGSDLRFNGASGIAGDVATSGGPGNPPVWSPGTVRSATAPDTTQFWWHTTDNVEYYYDSTYGEWLSKTEYTLDTSTNLASSTANCIMQQGGVVAMIVSSSERGWPAPFNLKVTGWTWRIGSTVASRELTLGKFDTSAGTNNLREYSITPASWKVHRESGLDVDYDVEDCVGLIAYGTTSMVYPRCTVTYRRRPS